MVMGRFRRKRRRTVETIVRRFRVEPLEGRQLLSNIYTVTNTSDNGSTGSLRWAITQVDADSSDSVASPDRIDFNIPQGDPGYSGGIWAIAPTSALPAVTKPVVIDGYTQAGASANTNGPGLGDNAVLAVELSGDLDFPETSTGLQLRSSGITVRGLIVEGFGTSLGGTAGITIDGPGGDTVEGDFLGTGGQHVAVFTNAYGVVVESAGNTIGGTTPAARNVISGNTGEYSGNYGRAGVGVFVEGANNVIEGNLVGTDVSGTAPVANAYAGIVLSGNANTVGGTALASRNVIAGDGGFGVVAGGDGSLIEGNDIGADITGIAPVYTAPAGQSDTTVGIELQAANVTVGGTAAGAGNVISGNGTAGIQVSSQTINPSSILIEGNLIGTNATGSAALSNGTGIAVYSNLVTIGGTTAAARNVISGNAGDGVYIGVLSFPGSFQPAFDLVEGNFLGTDVQGVAALPNQEGVVLDGAQYSTIGGTAAGAGNLISGNSGNGIAIESSASSLETYKNVVVGNTIGTDVTGRNPLGNHDDGVYLGPALGATGVSYISQNVIGEDLTGSLVGNGSNVISFNGGAGVAVVGDLTTENPIQANTIFGNVALGIDLGGTGKPLLNTPGGPHTGPNQLQNWPQIVALSFTGGNTSITGELSAVPNDEFEIEFYADRTPDPSGFGQGETYLGRVFATTLPSSNPTVSATFPFTFTYDGNLAGQYITATATDSQGNTSEFAQNVAAPASGPPVELTVAPAPSQIGQPITVTAFLPKEPIYGGNPAGQIVFAATGTVTFLVDGHVVQSPVTLEPASAPSGLPGAEASITLAGLPAGVHVITAHYNGGNLPPSQSSVTQTVVNPVAPHVGLTVAPDPAAAGQPVTFRVSVTRAGAPSSRPEPAPGGFVDLREGSVTLARLQLDGAGQAQFTTTALAVGDHHLTAYYEGDVFDLAGTSNTVVALIQPADGPTVLSVRRYGIHRQPTSVVLTFSEPVDPSTGQNPNNYRVLAPGGRPIQVNSALYDGSADTIALTFARNLSLHLRYRLIINGTGPQGVKDIYGNLLDGANTGHPGSHYVTTLTFRNLTLGQTFPGGPGSGRRAGFHFAAHRARIR